MRPKSRISSMSMISRRMNWPRGRDSRWPPRALNWAARSLNCGAALTGRYCANCGQTADVHVPSTRELFHEAIEGITHSDSRLWNSLKLLWFKPGKLTQEFVAGRRAAYLPPFRLYLVFSVIFFFFAAFFHPALNL